MSSDIFVPIVVALIAGISPLTAVVVTARTSKKRVAEIHVLVNSRLTQALNEIADLKKMLDAKDKVLAEQREEIKNPTS